MSRLTRAATALGLDGRGRKPRSRRLPVLWLITDPARVPDPAAAAARLPRGSGVIYRAFGAADALATARALRQLAHRHGLTLLIGADAALAAACRADGVHLPERMARRAPGLRRTHPRWLITTAAHDRPAVLRAKRLGADAAMVSVVFASRSPSAGDPMGPVRFAGLIRGARLPVIALGGVNATTAPRLVGTGAAAMAALEGLTRLGG